MKIPLPGGGYLEPDDGRRDTSYHRRIVRSQPLPEPGRTLLMLDCGHSAIAFGDVAKLIEMGNVVLCTHCRDVRD